MGELEEQLAHFPYAKHDDIPDALQGCMQLLKYPRKVTNQNLSPDTDIIDYLIQENRNRRKPQSAKLGTFLFGKKNQPTIPAKKALPSFDL